MKILQVIYTLGQGGAERFVLDLTNELAKNNDVYLIVVRGEDLDNDFFKNELSPRVIYKSLNFKPGTRPLQLFKFFKVIQEIQPEIVHSHLNTILFSLFPSIFFKDIRFIHTIHNNAKNEATNPFFGGLRKIFFKKRLIKPITISEESKSSFFKFYGFDNSTLIYNGRSIPKKTSKYDFVKSHINILKPNPDYVVFLHVARFAPQKNQEMLIKVFNRLVAENESVILLFLGMGFDHEEAKHLVKGASKGIYFLGGKKNVPDYFLLSDAFCLSSHYEGMPISLIEALACNCIPICTPVGGVVNIIENSVNGFLSKDTSEDSYYLAVKEFIKGRNNINKRLLNSLFVDKFSIEKCAEEYIKAYTSLLN